MKLTTKLVSAVSITLLATVGLSGWYTSRKAEAQAERAFRDKVRQISGMAGATRSWYSSNLDKLVPDRKFKYLEQVPVVAAWQVARTYAEKEGMTFKTPSLAPRNPANTPDDFERRALTAFQANPELHDYFEWTEENGRKYLRYAQPVRVEADCLICHGDPAGEKDPFGKTKEGMKAGELRAAFSISAPADELVQNARANSWTAFLTSCFSLLAAAGVIFFLLRKIVIRPLRSASELAHTLADKNLATEDIPIESEDEIGETSAALNKMKNSLREVIASITVSAERIATAGEEISATATQQAQGAETQKDQTHQVATAMQGMSSTVQQVSENSNKAAEASRTAAETARKGGSIVDETLAKMRAIADSVGQTARKVQELGKSSDQIGQIIGVIDDIADQTNLLALNAAIEAARAGEQGRGFAVVADEVRKLAERTSKATKEITQMIQNIQTETRSAVQAMQAGTKQVELGVESTTQAGCSLQEIIKMSVGVGDMVMQIATAATEQASATEEINSNIEQIAKITQETAAGANQSAKAVHELSSLATELQSLVGRFNVGNGNGAHVTRGSGPRAAGNGKSRVHQPEPESETVDA